MAEKVVVGSLLAFVGVIGELAAKGYMYYLHFSGLLVSQELMLTILTIDSFMFALILLGVLLIWTDMKPVLRDSF